MIWLIAKKEFWNNIVTSGFMVGLVLCLLLIPYSVYTGIKTYENRLAQYETDMKSAEDVYQKSQIYAQVDPIIVKPVSPLSIFSKGISEQTGSKVQLDRKEKPVFSSGIVSLNENPFMGNFLSLDFVTALTILFSLLGILFSYDMLSREKEDGTLKLALVNSLSRSTFFLGKITGIFFTLLPILLICFLAVFIIIIFSPSVHFTLNDYGRIGMMILISLVYFAFFVFLGGFISSRTKSSVTSIIINVFIWCFLLFLLPNAASYLGKNITKTDDYKNLTYNTAQIDSEFWNTQNKEISKKLGEEHLTHVGYNFCAGGDWDGGNMIFFTPIATMKYERRKKELINPILLENSNKKWQLQAAYLDQLYHQEKTVRYFSSLSPAGILKQISASLCHTGVQDEVNFMNQIRTFQDIYYGYYIQNKIYSSYAYFTPQKEEDFPESWTEGDQDAQTWKETAKPESTFDFTSFGYLDTSDLPRFTYVPSTFSVDMKNQIYLLTALILVCILFFWFSFISFIKYDIR